MRTPEFFRCPRAGTVPNSRLPVLLYRGALKRDAGPSVYEEVFLRNGWSNAWRNDVYPFHHFHSTSHEVLGIARGHAVLRLGVKPGQDVPVSSGDVVILPAGTGHRRISSEGAFLVRGITAINLHRGKRALPVGSGRDLQTVGSFAAGEAVAIHDPMEAHGTSSI